MRKSGYTYIICYRSDGTISRWGPYVKSDKKVRNQQMKKLLRTRTNNVTIEREYYAD